MFNKLKKNLHWIILVVIILSLLAVPKVTNFRLAILTGRSYYVSNAGSDTNTGSLESPLKTIPKALALVQPGESVVVRGGSYPSLTINKSGTSGNYITLKAYQSETPVISGGSQVVRFSASFVILDGFEIINAAGSNVAGVFVTSGYGNNIIQNNHIHNNDGDGVIVDNGSGNKILNNVVHDNRTVGIKVRGSSTNNEISGNTVYHNVINAPNADGIAVTDRSSYSLIKNNVVYDNADDGIDTWSSHHNTLIGNVVHGQRGAGDGNGLKLGGTPTGGHNTVIGNISYNNKRDGFDSNHSGGNIYYNNVAYGNSGVGFEDVAKFVGSDTSIYINNIGYNNARNFAASSFTEISHNNIWFSNSGGANVRYEGNSFSSLAAFYASSGNRLDNPNAGALSSYQLNPLFVNVAGGDFRLGNLSPAINKGDPSNPGNVFSLGVVDIGAIESGVDVIVTVTPLVFTNTPTLTRTATQVPPSRTPTPTPTVTQIVVSQTPTSTQAPVCYDVLVGGKFIGTFCP